MTACETSQTVRPAYTVQETVILLQSRFKCEEGCEPSYEITLPGPLTNPGV